MLRKHKGKGSDLFYAEFVTTHIFSYMISDVRINSCMDMSLHRTLHKMVLHKTASVIHSGGAFPSQPYQTKPMTHHSFTMHMLV